MATVALAALCFSLMAGPSPGLICLGVGGAFIVLQSLTWRIVHLQYVATKKQAPFSKVISKKGECIEKNN